VSKQSSVSSTHFGYTGWWRLLPQPSYSDLANNLFASACAGASKGHSFSYNCSLPTYEMCVQEVIAGNRGFCSPNPVLPQARIRSAQGQAEGILLLIHWIVLLQ
jgi:hypothetical protein